MLRPLGATTRPAGSVSVKPMPVNGIGLTPGLLTVKVRLVVPPSGRFIMADFPRANGFPWPGRMGPNSPFPGAAIAVLGAQLVPATVTHPPQMWIRAEIRGGNIDVIFDQFLTVTYSYNPGT